MLAGLAVYTAGVWMLNGIGPGSGLLFDVLPGLSVMACGMALFGPPLTTATLGALDDTDHGIASGANNAVGQLGGCSRSRCCRQLPGSAMQWSAGRCSRPARLRLYGSPPASRPPPPSWRRRRSGVAPSSATSKGGALDRGARHCRPGGRRHRPPRPLLPPLRGNVAVLRGGNSQRTWPPSSTWSEPADPTGGANGPDPRAGWPGACLGRCGSRQRRTGATMASRGSRRPIATCQTARSSSPRARACRTVMPRRSRCGASRMATTSSSP
jgi:hypothetical protein